jgi:S-DNA-T family DNA segregation ATPase FtsK/SpoIIIE
MSEESENKKIQGLKEIAVISLVVIALFYLIALISFDPVDDAWRHQGTNVEILNAGGVVGAWLSDLSFTFFGVVAFIFPFILLRHSLVFFFFKQRSYKICHQFLRCLGLVLMLSSLAVFCSLYILTFLMPLPREIGGIYGQGLGEFLIISFGNSGATLLLFVAFFSGITLYENISWGKVLEILGAEIVNVIEKLICKIKMLMGHIPVESETSSYQATNARPSNEFEAEDVVPFDIQEPEPTIAPVELEAQELVDQPEALTVQKIQADIFKDKIPEANELPSPDLLDIIINDIKGYSKEQLDEMSVLVEQALKDFNVLVEVTGVLPGPVITRFELQLAAGVKVSRITGLAKDLARSLSVTSVRVVEVIAGKSVIGIEIPNKEREMVSFREGLESEKFKQSKSPLSLLLGKDIAGLPVVADLAKMPHLLVAGTTGSGKSVAINTMILSMLYKSTPNEVRMIMIDPKMLELSVYEGIPHLLTPVVTDMKDAANALRWAVAEMERRYKLMSKVGVRNLAGFNKLVAEADAKGEPIKAPLYSYETELAEGESFPTLSTLPHIVVVVDELADMMMIVGKKVEELIARLAQKARAAGIHLILATQRPSVDVLTGLIKANVPSRLSFQVSSRIDSRTVLDQGGAEYLLGNGDMLFMPAGTNIPIRAHGAFVDDHEVHQIVEFIKKTAPTNYLSETTQEYTESGDGSYVSSGEAGDAEQDELYDQVVMFVTQSRKASISSVQRKFRVGYNRAATIIEAMELAGVIGAAEGNGSRQVLAPGPIKDEDY